MRLSILDLGHGLGTKLLFGVIRLFSGQPVLDVIKLTKYRPAFYGGPMQRVTQEAMRGPSSWSIEDRELMAAVVAHTSGSEWCTKAHSAVAKQAAGDESKVVAVLADLETAPIDEPLRAVLRLLRKLTRDRSVDVGDMRRALTAGASREQIEDALAIAFAFHVIGRLADAFGFREPGPAAFEAGAKYLLTHGYR